MLNYLITGASGLVAKEVIQMLLKQPQDINIFCQSRSKKIPAHLHQYKNNFEWINCSLSKPLPKNLVNKINVIYHLSAQTSVYKARDELNIDLNANFYEGVQLLKSFKKTDVTFILAGSATQIGYSSGKVLKNTKSNPETFYDLHKTLLEMYLNQYIKEKWIKGCTLKLANVYGARLASQSADRGVLDKIFLKAKNNEEIQIFGGDFYRDYIHIEDVANAFLCASKNINKSNGKSYFIATGSSIKLKDAFSMIIKIASKKYSTNPSIVFKDMPEDFYKQESRSVRYNIDKSIKDLHWRPNINFIDGINKTYNE